MRRLLALPLVAVVALFAAGVSNAGREQQTLTHSRELLGHHTSPPESGTAADLGIVGVNPSDTIEFDFSAQVVIKQKH